MEIYENINAKTVAKSLITIIHSSFIIECTQENGLLNVMYAKPHLTSLTTKEDT